MDEQPKVGEDIFAGIESTEAVAPASDDASKKDARMVAKKKKRAITVTRTGRIYIQATYNNTMISATDDGGNVLAWSSAGSCGFRGPKKSTSYAASVVVRELMRKLDGVGLSEVQVFVKGVGSGRESAVRALNAHGLIVTAIKDVTPIPHNGPRPPKVRRV